MEKQLEHTPTPYHAAPSRVTPLENIMARGGQHIAVVTEGRIKQGTPEGNRDFILRACNNHDALVGAVNLFLNAIHGEGEHDKGAHDIDDCDVCDAIDEAKRLLVRLKEQGKTSANDLLMEAIDLIAEMRQDAIDTALNLDLSPADQMALKGTRDDCQEWLDKAKGKPSD